MPDFYLDVDVALAEVPVNIFPLTDDTDFKTRETAVAYNAAGMDLVWNFVTSAGATTQTAVTPTTAGDYDWTHQGDGMYTIEIPASAGASINNDTEGYGWFTGFVTGVMPWRGPTIGFRDAAINDSLLDTNTTGLLAPTTAGRTLNVASTGEAGIDLNNINLPVGAIPALGIIDNGTAQSATSTTLVARAASAFADNTIRGCILMAFGSTQGYWQQKIITSNTLATDTFEVDAWTVTPSGTITYMVIGAPPASSNSAVIPSVSVTKWSGTDVATPTVAGVPEVDITHVAGAAEDLPTATALAALNNISVSDILTTAMTESYAADGATMTLAQALYEITQSIGDFSISGTTLTVKQRDGTTTAATYTLDSATAPTSRTRAT